MGLAASASQFIVVMPSMSRTHDLAGVDLNLLVVLDELLRARSTTLAARRLGRTQSAVSHALARLRVALEDPLFIRAGAGLRPTAAAEALEAPLRQLLADAASMLRGQRGALDPAKIERTFIVAGSDYAEIVLLPRLIPRLRREAPAVNVVTRFLGDDVDRALQMREVDCAYGASLRPVSGVVLESVAEVPFAVLLRRGHRALRSRLTAAAYVRLEHVLVTPRGLPGSAVDQALEPLGLERRVVVRMPHFAAAAFLVARTDLAVTVPADFARAVAPGLGLVSRPVPFPMRASTFLLGYSATFESDAAHRWFRTCLLDAARGAGSAVTTPGARGTAGGAGP